MRKLFKMGSVYFVYEIAFVSFIFLILFFLASQSVPEKAKENCDTLTGSCVKVSADQSTKKVTTK